MKVLIYNRACSEYHISVEIHEIGGLDSVATKVLQNGVPFLVVFFINQC